MEEFELHVKDTNLYCRRYGTAKDPVVMVHGACVDSDFFHETAMYLSYYFTVYTYDRRGYGRNDPVHVHSLEEQAEDLAELIRQIHQKCYIVAHSAGTVIAMKFGRMYPHKIRGMFLYEPVVSRFVCKDKEYLHTIRQVMEKREQYRYNTANYYFMKLLGEKDPRARTATEEEMLHLGKNSLCFMKEEFDEIYEADLDYEKLADLPLVIGLGEQSLQGARAEMAKKLQEVTQSRLVYFPSGHNCPFDLPREFAYLTRSILENMEEEHVSEF